MHHKRNHPAPAGHLRPPAAPDGTGGDEPGLARITSGSLLGVTGHSVRVEITVSRGLPSVTAAGLDDTTFLQSRDRLRAAIGNAGHPWPDRRITVSALPVELPKQPATLDLPIALGLLAAAGSIPPKALIGLAAIGELGLGGDLRPTRGVLPAIVAAYQAGIRTILVPAANLAEAAHAPAGISVRGAHTLTQAVEWLRGNTTLDTPNGLPAAAPDPDFAEVAGRPRARRALELAAAGRHHLLLIGRAGSPRSMLARRLPGLLPDPTEPEALEIACIRSAAGLFNPQHSPLTRRPFRAPHHSLSQVTFTGGGRALHPGELTLAHHGVLHLDELDQYPGRILECLRQPLEKGTIQLLHRRRAMRLPARFLLVAADTHHRTHPNPLTGLSRLNDALTGLVWGRIEIAVKVPALRAGLATGGQQAGESSAVVRARVIAARALQHDRGPRLNASLPPAKLMGQYPRNSQAWRAATGALDRHPGMTLVDLHSLLRVARTIADPADSVQVTADHVTEALEFLPALHATSPQEVTPDRDDQ